MDWRLLGIRVGNIAIVIIGVFYSIILHEIGHGYTAKLYGDDTAKRAGRLSLNPIPHIDLLGTIILPIGLYIAGLPLFGWAKPVPVNPYNFRREKIRQGLAMVSISGVILNFVLAIIFMNLFFILMKVPALAKSIPESMKLLDATAIPTPLVFLQIAGINIMLMVFNLLPLPPLDGYNFMISVLPEKPALWLEKNKTILTVGLLVLLMTGVFKYIFNPIFNLFYIVFALIWR